MLDRAPTKPNRYAVYDDAHNFIRYEYHERADEPTQAGDALNKANLLPDDVATALGLTGNPQVKDALLSLNTWRLLQAYTVAGSYTFTVPEGIKKLGVFIIGAGGSGAALVCSGHNSNSSTVYSGAASGGAAGYTKSVIMNVSSGATFPVVVGAKGASVTTTGSNNSANGKNGGGSSFNGAVANGGEGGKTKMGANTSSDKVQGALGGQSSDAVPSYQAFSPSYSIATPPKMGEEPFRLSNSTIYNSFARTMALSSVNFFNGLRYLAAGGGLGLLANSWYDSSTAQINSSVDDGSHSGAAALTIRLDSSGTATGQSATGHGNGGGAAGVVEAYTSQARSHTATSGAGSDGAVFIYGR